MSELRVYIRPEFEGPDNGEGGIRRWVEMQHRYLPEYGIVPVKSEDVADVVVCHAGDIVNTHKLQPLVCHNHGLYNTAQQEWSRWAWLLNSHCIELLRRADIVTAPSSWVAQQLARGMSIGAKVVHAGIEPDRWTPGVNEGYVLWNKTRVDPVCDPAPVFRLAEMNRSLQFVSTYGTTRPNLKLTGKVSYDKAREYIQNAAVYLATTKETFGIGTVEAMACGVPVLGWAWGGQLDIVRHGETGYLAQPGDYEDLQRGLVACLERREEWGAAAREDAIGRFTWERFTEQLAGIYREAAGLHQGPKVSVIVPVYNLEAYLPECLDSLKRQTLSDWECLIVDDCSPGNCSEIAEGYAREDSRFKYVRTPRNLYLAGARNYAIAQSRGRYILPLDCDDMLGERALEVLSGWLDKEPGYAIAYASMEVINTDSSRFVSGWPKEFNWAAQMAHRNQLPYASMYRRMVWERTGGYRERCQTAEDADFWCRVTSFGFRAHKVSNYPYLIKREREEGMGRNNREPDWTIWYPWARDRRAVPFGAVGEPENRLSWPVRTFDNPLVSVVIPVGPGHESLVRDALDSVLAQTFGGWECIVVNDTGQPLPLDGFPWARVVSTSRPGSGPAVARNAGLAVARGELFCLLDADDYLMPEYLMATLDTQKRFGGYAYTDWFKVDGDGTSETHRTPEYSVENLIYDGFYHAVTILAPLAAWKEVGGFDEGASGWEDWDFVFALATRGYCGTRVPSPLFCYRFWSGQVREKDAERSKDNARRLRRKWAAYIDDKEALMACSSCGKGGGKTRAPATQPSQGGIAQAAESGMVLIEYVGADAGTRTYQPRGRGLSGQVYRFGGTHRRGYVWGSDADWFLRLPGFRRAKPDAPSIAETSEPVPVRQATNRVAV